MKNKLKYLIALVLATALFAGFAVYASAEDNVEESAEAVTETNFFSRAYEEVAGYASEILCGLTLAGSLTLAFAYKKGLLPLVERSLLAIGNAVSGIKESAKESAESGSKLKDNVEKRLSAASETLEALADKISSLDKALCASLENESEARLEAKELRLVVDAQIDMLYDVFMSSALPQYQKDAVGERIAKMKEAMANNAIEK
jgi:hypothetical protein